MFGLFKKKSPAQKLQEKYERLMKESYELSTIDRTASDKKRGDAEMVLKEIDALGN